MSILKTLVSTVRAFGVDPVAFVNAAKELPRFVKEYYEFKKQHATIIDAMPIGPIYPCLHDYHAQSGAVRSHYFLQDLYVAQKIFNASPAIHVDVGSRVDGFVAHIASFRQIVVMDIRPLNVDVANIEFCMVNVMDSTETAIAECCDSLSCLHALEHFGLGRYGDPIDINGHIDGFKNLMRLLRPGGILYLSVPIGRPRIEFNAHRIFSIRDLLGLAAAHGTVEELSYIDDSGHFHRELNIEALSNTGILHCEHGCAILQIRKVAVQ